MIARLHDFHFEITKTFIKIVTYISLFITI
jgi:hypothetical protein